MKKTIFLFVALLVVSAAQAKYIKAILYMNDGSQKKGLAEMVEYKDSNVRFKADENAKSEKFSSSLISPHYRCFTKVAAKNCNWYLENCFGISTILLIFIMYDDICI